MSSHARVSASTAARSASASASAAAVSRTVAPRRSGGTAARQGRRWWRAPRGHDRGRTAPRGHREGRHRRQRARDTGSFADGRGGRGVRRESSIPPTFPRRRWSRARPRSRAPRHSPRTMPVARIKDTTFHSEVYEPAEVRAPRITLAPVSASAPVPVPVLRVEVPTPPSPSPVLFARPPRDRVTAGQLLARGHARGRVTPASHTPRLASSSRWAAARIRRHLRRAARERRVHRVPMPATDVNPDAVAASAPPPPRTAWATPSRRCVAIF